ncbi:hypothetical protein PFISCL1PPCAC_3299, partial [Pristionchus fissidentatus]
MILHAITVSVILTSFCCYAAEEQCAVNVLKVSGGIHNSTYARVMHLTLLNPDVPRVMINLKACLSYCDSLDSPAFSFHYLSKLCSPSDSYADAGPERLDFRVYEGQDKYLGLFVRMPDMPVLEECYPSKESFEEYLKQWVKQNKTFPASDSIVPTTLTVSTQEPGSEEEKNGNGSSISSMSPLSVTVSNSKTT